MILYFVCILLGIFFEEMVLCKRTKNGLYLQKIIPDSGNVGHWIELKIEQHFAAITPIMCSNYILQNQTFPIMRKDWLPMKGQKMLQKM